MKGTQTKIATINKSQKKNQIFKNQKSGKGMFPLSETSGTTTNFR